MTSRERILTTLNGEIPDRVGRMESFWSETIEKWKTQGMPENALPEDHFGLDIAYGPGFDHSLGFPIQILEDTDDYVVQWDADGVLRKDFKRESGHTPHWLDHKLRSGADWWANKERLAPTDDRIAADARETFSTLRAKGKFVTFTTSEPYEHVWKIFGQVGIFTMMMDEPNVVKDIFDTYADLTIALAGKMIGQGIEFDGAWFWGDLGYRNGTLFSPTCYNELLFPAHRRLCDFFRSHGKPAILHSCGKIETLIPKFIEAGFSAIQPLEVKCGQDARVLKGLYGDKITLFGNMDVRALSGTKEDVENEIKLKLPVAMKGGRYIFHSDHSVPPTVSYDNYLYAIELAENYGKY